MLLYLFIVCLYLSQQHGVVQCQDFDAYFNLDAYNVSMSHEDLDENITTSTRAIFARDFYDRDLQMTVTLNPEKYCSIRCGRHIPGITCKRPQTPDSMSVKFTLYQNGNQVRQLNWKNPGERQFLTNNRVVFVIHGFMKTIDYPFMKDFKDAFLSHDFNVIIVDWTKGSSVTYPQAIANARVVGAMIGRAVINWEIAPRTLLTGFSLGAPVASEAGQYVKKYSNQIIDECHGLDPAGPNFDGCSSDISLNRNDCRLVQIIHTNAASNAVVGALSFHLGSFQKNGHCDYWINCGHDQGCIGRLCSHAAAVQVYLKSVTKKCDYKAYDCPSCGRNPFCRVNVAQTPSNGLVPFANCSPNQNNNYYVPTGKGSDKQC